MLLLRASVLALVNCGMTIAAKMPRMITTIRISTSVKPRRLSLAERMDVFFNMTDLLRMFMVEQVEIIRFGRVGFANRSRATTHEPARCPCPATRCMENQLPPFRGTSYVEAFPPV